MRWLAEYRIKTNLRLEAGQSELRHDFSGTEILLRNTPDYDHRGEGLLARIIFTSDGDADAELEADSLLEAFLNLLSFATNVGARIAHRVYLAEWPEIPGPIKLFQYAYTEIDDPIEMLTPKTLEAVENLNRRQEDGTLSQAFSYFNSALRSNVLVDQFQFFWFVVETLSTRVKIEAEPDRCTCGGALVCLSCEKEATRSSSRKKIDAVLKSTGLDPRLIRGMSKVRNMLLHGSDGEAIEEYMQTKMKFPDFTMAKAVEVLADHAWLALARTMKGFDDKDWPEFEHAAAIKMYRLVGRAEMGIGPGPDGRAIDMNDLPIGTVSIIRQ